MGRQRDGLISLNLRFRVGHSQYPYGIVKEPFINEVDRYVTYIPDVLGQKYQGKTYESSP
jgi:hypothetical protein